MTTVKDALAAVDAFLQKVGAEAPEFEAKDKQGELGKDQASAAKDACRGTPDIKSTKNSNEDDKKKTVDGLGNPDVPKKLLSEEPSSNQPKKREDYSGEVKEAAEAINNLSKAASALLGRLEKAATEPVNPKQGAAEQVARLEAEVLRLSKSASQAAPQTVDGIPTEIIDAMQKSAAYEAQDYYESHLAGQLARLRDEVVLSQPGQQAIPQALIEKNGGVSRFLDKVAAEAPENILPPEALMAAEQGAGMEAPPEMAGAAMDPGADPAAAGGDPAAAGDGGQVMDQLAQALSKAGVTPQDLQKAFEDIQALSQAGVAPEELAQALEQWMAENEQGGAPAEKAASDRNRIDDILDYLRPGKKE
jgi:hypothetical protein